jgi:hypothetical protein
MTAYLQRNTTTSGPGKIIRLTPLAVWLASLLLLGAGSPPAQADAPIPVLLVLAPHANAVEQIGRLRTLINASGGNASHLFPGHGVIAYLPASMVAQFAAQPDIRAVYTQALTPVSLDALPAETRPLAESWNSFVAPEPSLAAASAELVETAEAWGEPPHAFEAPDLFEDGAVKIASSASVSPDYYQTSEFMAGSIAVGLVLVESNGAQDRSTENWAPAEKQQVVNEIMAGLNWWAQLEPRAHLSFVYDDHFTHPLPTSVEPITRPYSDQKYWIAEALKTLGYSASSYFTQVRDYNNALRDLYRTDWAFTIFVVDSSTDADNRFSDGYFAYSYLGGPFMVLTSGNNGYGTDHLDAVAAHEMGHLFHALDQYAGARQSCERISGYLGVQNQNSEYGLCATNMASIMRGQILPYHARVIDPYAAGQIGWRDEDGDNILDPLDTQLPVTIDALSQNGNTLTVSGQARVEPFPSPYRSSITVNKIVGVQYRLDGGTWQQAWPSDGQFNATSEGYQLTVVNLAPGYHLLEVAAVDTAGNRTGLPAQHHLATFDPVDGGLNTDLYAPSQGLTINSLSTLPGVAYHMEGKTISGVEFRIDGGGWQPALAQDGRFDSAYEAVIISLETTALEPRRYIVEARAIDESARIETNPARATIEIKQGVSLFLPLVAR